ncbi:MAG: preprotein translocase subunit SecE [Candidatus Saccharimonadales bacterium]
MAKGREVVKSKKSKKSSESNETMSQVFWKGFFWPVKVIGRGLAWTTHQPPLKQIGHGLRWFSRLRFVRLIGRLLLLRYIRDSWRELKQVNWPSRRESRRLTTAVILFAIVFGAAIAVVDYGLDKLFKQVLLK